MREIDFDHFVSRPISEVKAQSLRFVLKLLENCRENLEKLRICCNKFDKNLMHFAAAADFANLKELVIHQGFGIDCDQLNLPVFCARRWNLTAIRLDIKNFESERGFFPHWLHAPFDRTSTSACGVESATLTRQMIESFLNPNLKKLFLAVKSIEDGAFIRIAEICGANLEIFHFESIDDSGHCRLRNGLNFLPLCPRLRELFVDYHCEYPTQIWQRRFADLLPNGLEILRRSAMKFDELIAEMIEICKSRLRRQNFAQLPRLVYVIDEERYSDERIRGRLGDGGKALLKVGECGFDCE